MSLASVSAFDGCTKLIWKLETLMTWLDMTWKKEELQVITYNYIKYIPTTGGFTKLRCAWGFSSIHPGWPPGCANVGTWLGQLRCILGQPWVTFQGREQRHHQFTKYQEMIWLEAGWNGGTWLSLGGTLGGTWLSLMKTAETLQIPRDILPNFPIKKMLGPRVYISRKFGGVSCRGSIPLAFSGFLSK